jgi:sugar/nucleoside kinase (ribokinase family)
LIKKGIIQGIVIMKEKIKVSGIGCCLVDLLYNNINFESSSIRAFLSRKQGDGGLTPGKLVFQEEFEKFCKASLSEILNKITEGKIPDKINIGGPSIVSLINAAQLTAVEVCEINFYGRGGNDERGHYLLSALKKMPVVLKDYKLIENCTPSTIVLSDPAYNNGHGERMFINSIGAAWDYMPDEPGDDFFNSDIVVFGGTALVPRIHDNLASLLRKARSRGCITIVNTVFDFRNEQAHPSQRWPMGESDDSYRYIDLLIADREEGLRLSGKNNIAAAVKFFQDKRISSLIITNGAEDITLYSDGSLFGPTGLKKMPVSEKIRNELKSTWEKDTTGCGDNFAGGVIASLVNQLKDGVRPPDLQEACCWGIVSGGFACFYTGGTWFEEKPGEKRAKIEPYYNAYKEQISFSG